MGACQSAEEKMIGIDKAELKNTNEESVSIDSISIDKGTRSWFSTSINDALTGHAASFSKPGDPQAHPPGVACAIVKVSEVSGKPVAHVYTGVGGSRQSNNLTNTCEPGDLFHLGSDGKAMTALLCAVLVDKGLITWDYSVKDCSDVVTDKTHGSFLNVTLKQLLSHTGGFCGGCGPIWDQAWQEHQNEAHKSRQQRQVCLSSLLKYPPEAEPGTVNWGYTMAGHMLECALNETYDDIIATHLFKPLGILTYGFGMPLGRDTPWGHGDHSKWEPRDPSTTAGSDNPIAITPAGRMHMKIDDWGRFIAVTLSSKLAYELLGLTVDTYNWIYEPVKSDYSTAGWLTCRRGWAKGQLFTHVGSNTLNSCVGWLAPQGLSNENTPYGTASLGYLVCTNTGNTDLLDPIVGSMISNIHIG